MIERAVILSRGPELELAAGLIPSIADAAADVPQSAKRSNGGAAPAADRSLAQIDKERIIAVLKQTNWHIEGPNGAAAILKLNPSTLRSRIKKLGVERSRDSTS